MKKYNTIIFDFDGTLANTYEGIFNSYKFALENIGLEPASVSKVNSYIGNRLLDVFIKEFNLSEEAAINAVSIYRQYYAEKGKFEVSLYGYMKELLEKLKILNFKIGIATLKNENFAREMADHLGILKYFDNISGMNNCDSLSKSDIIDICIDKLNADKENTLFIGDSEFDAIGSEKSNVDFIAVTYGFGFKNKEYEKYNHIVLVADKVKDIEKVL